MQFSVIRIDQCFPNRKPFTPNFKKCFKIILGTISDKNLFNKVLNFVKITHFFNHKYFSLTYFCGKWSPDRFSILRNHWTRQITFWDYYYYFCRLKTSIFLSTEHHSTDNKCRQSTPWSLHHRKHAQGNQLGSGKLLFWYVIFFFLYF